MPDSAIFYLWPRLWLVLAIPMLWCVVSGLTLRALDARWANVSLVAAALPIILAAWKIVRHRART